MTNGPLVCDVCQEPGQNLRRLQDVGLIEVAQGLNFQVKIEKDRFPVYSLFTWSFNNSCISAFPRLMPTYATCAIG